MVESSGLPNFLASCLSNTTQDTHWVSITKMPALQKVNTKQGQRYIWSSPILHKVNTLILQQNTVICWLWCLAPSVRRIVSSAPCRVLLHLAAFISGQILHVHSTVKYCTWALCSHMCRDMFYEFACRKVHRDLYTDVLSCVCTVQHLPDRFLVPEWSCSHLTCVQACISRLVQTRV